MVYCWDGGPISMKAAVESATEAGGGRGGGGGRSPREKQEGAWVLSGKKGDKSKQAAGVNLMKAFKAESNEGLKDL